MAKKDSDLKGTLASIDSDIPQAAAQAFNGAYLKALKSKAGVIVVSQGRLEHRHLKMGELVTVHVGEAPKPLIVGVGTRKKRSVDSEK